MVSYWLSFRLHDSDGWERTYNKRLTALHAEIEAASGGGADWWYETTSFYIFSSSETVDVLIHRVKRAIAESVDLVVIGMNEFKGGWIIGELQDADVFALAPDMHRV